MSGIGIARSAVNEQPQWEDGTHKSVNCQRQLRQPATTTWSWPSSSEASPLARSDASIVLAESSLPANNNEETTKSQITTQRRDTLRLNMVAEPLRQRLGNDINIRIRISLAQDQHQNHESRTNSVQQQDLATAGQRHHSRESTFWLNIFIASSPPLIISSISMQHADITDRAASGTGQEQEQEQEQQSSSSNIPNSSNRNLPGKVNGRRPKGHCPASTFTQPQPQPPPQQRPRVDPREPTKEATTIITIITTHTTGLRHQNPDTQTSNNAPSGP